MKRQTLAVTAVPFPKWVCYLVFVILYGGASSFASDCSVTSVGITPLSELGAGLYLGQFQGGLYPGGLNTPPPAHEAEGLTRAADMQPLDTDGLPSPTGKVVMMSIGMSNTTQEFCSQSAFEPCDSWTFMGQAADDPRVNQTTLRIVNGAMGGQAASSWDSPTDANYDRVRDDVLAPRGLTEAQVQVVWIKQANPGPTSSLPNSNADAYVLETNLGNIVRSVRIRYPNIKIAFLSSRIYAGYASTGLNPEPYAYESGFSMKWLIEAQINQMAGGPIDPQSGDLDYNSASPWLAWGPYLWADGLLPRGDGLIWECADLQSDGTHPAMSGEQKVGTMLLDFMLNSPFSEPWLRAAPQPGDCDENFTVNLLDYATFAACLSGPGSPGGSGCACGDLDDDNDTDMRDYLSFLFALTPLPPDLDPASDDFERAALGENWDILAGTPAIIDSSDFGAQASGFGFAAWQASSFSADQFCEVVLSANWNPVNSIQLCVRVNPQNSARYGFRWFGGGGSTLELRYHNGPTSVLLASVSGQALAPGDTMRIEVEGSTVRGLKNGNQILAGTDSNLVSGTAGIAVSFSGPGPASFVESWVGGSLTR